MNWEEGKNVTETVHPFPDPAWGLQNDFEPKGFWGQAEAQGNQVYT